MCRIYTLPDRFILYYGTRPVSESKSFIYIYMLYLALDNSISEQVVRNVRDGRR